MEQLSRLLAHVVTRATVDLASWPTVGRVFRADSFRFSFVFRQRPKIGSIVAVQAQIPSDVRSEGRDVLVWGRVVEIAKHRPLFPREAAHELSQEGMNLIDTVLSNSRDQLEATVLIVGCTATDEFKGIYPLTYPVQPAASVFYPPADVIKELLAGGIQGHTPLHIGTLIARQDVGIDISADRVVARHMAILAMTGGGKTVAARRILRELIHQSYPILILDPHGDYLGLWQKRHLFPDSEIQLLYPHIAMTENNRGIVEVLINKMTPGLTEPQREKLGSALAKIDPHDGERILDYIDRLRTKLNDEIANAASNKKGNTIPTLAVVLRSLKSVRDRLERMEQTNERMRTQLKALTFEKLPDPEGQPEGIISPKKVSILYLGGYDHLTQTTIASIILESLYEHRANLSNRIPPFLALIEEAHTFIPSAREGAADVPSLETIRKVITEGRKFGTGLILVSQRPSRVDETILAQCNSFLILRLVNPRDQNFVKQIMENLDEKDARMLPGFGPGQGVVSGQAVRFPLLVKIKMDDELRYDGLGDENFFEQVGKWKPDGKAPVRKRAADAVRAIADLPTRGGRGARRKNKSMRRQ